MKITTTAALALIAASWAVAPAAAQDALHGAADAAIATTPLTADDLGKLSTELRASKKQVVAQYLTLSDAEAARFWPVYDQYSAEQHKIRDKQVQLVSEYANTYGKYDDHAASDYITRWLQASAEEAALRQRYVPIVEKVIPGVKAASFFQIDSRLNKYIDLEVATAMPILEFQPGK